MKGFRALATLLGAVVVLAGVFWAGYTVASPSSAPTKDAAPTTVEATSGTIEHKIVLTASVSRQALPLTVNALEGYVLKVTDASTASQGDILYQVDARPVFAVVGSTPFWRDLAPGDSGDDVAQLNQMLVDTGFLAEPGQKFTAATRAAMKALLAEHGAGFDDVVPIGQLIAIPSEATPVMIDRSILYPGARLSGGERAISILDRDPSFAMIVTPTQAGMIPPGTTVRVHHGELTWDGVVGQSSTTDEGISLELLGADGGLVCGEECDALPPTATASLLTDVVLVPPATGVTVPVAAISTHADGTTSVTRVAGDAQESVNVTVVGVSGGLAVVEGVEEGDTLLLSGPQEEESLPGSSPSRTSPFATRPPCPSSSTA